MNTSIRQVHDAVAAYYQIDPYDMAQAGNMHHFCRPRHVVAYIAHEIFKYTLPVIGRFYGKHHTTVLSGIKHVKTELETYQPVITAVLAVLPKYEPPAAVKPGTVRVVEVQIPVAPPVEVVEIRVDESSDVPRLRKQVASIAANFRIQNYHFEPLYGTRKLQAKPNELDAMLADFGAHLLALAKPQSSIGAA